MNSYFYATDNIVEFKTDLTAFYCYQCDPLFHFVDVDMIIKKYFYDLDIIQVLNDIQWDFTVGFNESIGLNLSRKCSIIDTLCIY